METPLSLQHNAQTIYVGYDVHSPASSALLVVGSNAVLAQEQS